MFEGKNPTETAQQAKKMEQEQKDLDESLKKIKNTIIVLSGKGGVGKSTVAANLAVSLSKKGYKTGLMDIDIHGPSIPTLLGIEDKKITNAGIKLEPIQYDKTLKVISVGFLLEDGKDPVIWRGPLKYGIIKQFIKDVHWGELDYLVVDSPPGTGDEPLSICQLIENATGAVVVTTPQDVALLDVKKSITFCEKLNMPILGVVENMSGFTCPHCGESADIFKSGGGAKMSEEMNVPFIGSLPIDPRITLGGDSGNPVVAENDKSFSQLQTAFSSIIEKILEKK